MTRFGPRRDFLVATLLSSNRHLYLSVPVIMREVISLHVGQAGVQIGNACCKSLPPLIASFALKCDAHRGALHARARVERMVSSSSFPSLSDMFASLAASLTVVPLRARRLTATAAFRRSSPRRARASTSPARFTSILSLAPSTTSRRVPTGPCSTLRR